jgi:hypothetical protein
MAERTTIIQQTRNWVKDVVVGLNLCPFAAPVLKQNSLHIEICDSEQEEQLLEAVLQQLDFLQSRPEQQVATSLLVFSKALADFDDYLMILDAANELLLHVQLDGVIQIASFHPDYCFDGAGVDDVSNYTNRSPWPMLHFIREAQISRLLSQYPNPEQIPDHNIRCLQAMGLTEIKALLKRCYTE